MSITSSGGKTVDVLSGKLVMDQANNRMLLDDGTNYRMLIGQAPDGSIVVAITPEGLDVIEELSA